MLRRGPQPLHSGGLEADVGVEAARDGTVDEGLLLLLQQRDQLLLGADVAPNAPIGMVEEADDGGLFGKGWKYGSNLSNFAFTDSWDWSWFRNRLLNLSVSKAIERNPDLHDGQHNPSCCYQHSTDAQLRVVCWSITRRQLWET